MNKKIAEFMVMCVNDFAREKHLAVKESFNYLNEHKGLDYLQDYYDIEHTLSPADTVEALTIVCKQNGGDLQ
ncbi:MAG: DUF3791 domain-containing protein [Chitinispirillia bacterium]|nr:DUF3791 domain-containing protein [Chitinispirillia bacterium]